MEKLVTEGHEIFFLDIYRGKQKSQNIYVIYYSEIA